MLEVGDTIRLIAPPSGTGMVAGVVSGSVLWLRPGDVGRVSAKVNGGATIIFDGRLKWFFAYDDEGVLWERDLIGPLRRRQKLFRPAPARGKGRGRESRSSRKRSRNA
jgi:hypothetical protein